MSPLAYSYWCCSWCHGSGLYRGRWCGCASRAMDRERAAARDQYELLWLDSRRQPDYFPPSPVPRSSLHR